MADALAALPGGTTGILVAALGLNGLLLSGGALAMLLIEARHSALVRRLALIAPQSAGALRAGGADAGIGGVRRVPQAQQIAADIARARLQRNRKPTLFRAVKAASALGTACFGFILLKAAGVIHGRGGLAVGLVPLLAIAGWLVPVFARRVSAARRKRAVADGLPEALDLLVICVEAGLSLESALDRVVVELRRSRPQLAEELALTAADLKILPERDQAFANFANRIAVPSVRSVVGTLSQTLRYGTPLAQALRIMATVMRTEALIELEQRANVLPALMTVPMIVLLLPVIFLIVGGPAALQAFDAFHQR